MHLLRRLRMPHRMLLVLRLLLHHLMHRRTCRALHLQMCLQMHLRMLLALHRAMLLVMRLRMLLVMRLRMPRLLLQHISRARMAATIAILVLVVFAMPGRVQTRPTTLRTYIGKQAQIRLTCSCSANPGGLDVRMALPRQA